MNLILLTFLKNAAPYVAAGIAGFGLAFGIQELRLTHVEQQFAQYKLDQQAVVQHQIDQANKQRKEAFDVYQAQQKQLEVSIQAGEVFRRCVAAGKCGVRNPVPRCPEPSVSTPERADGPGPDAVSATTGDAAINECAETTLRLNNLQADIEAQPGYPQQ